ncbi:acyl-CoA thioesterase [Altererythrobacter sp. MF3-039]|uniref:acyl-CoA thioesterase n=1 Tax=Altererythrobacter sp. MF3-039 TaxID=3252901 RepID=UPI00390C4EA5
MTDSIPDEKLVAGFVKLLTVDKASEDQFVGRPQKGGMGRMFGGQVIAQALQAAQATVADGKAAHSLHAYFLRGGEEGPPVDYSIARDFDGRSFSNRRVVASQEGRPILNLTASFQTPEDGLEHVEAPMPEVPGPEELVPDMDLRRKMVEKAGDRISEAQRAAVMRPRPVELRSVGPLHWSNSQPSEPRAHSWFRTVAPLPDDSAIHRAIIAYASDFTLLGTSALPHGLSWMRGDLVGASLDHALWFHREARADEWLLYATDSPWSGAGRGFNRGQIFNQNGELVASVAQEGMMRKRRQSK